MKSGYTTLRLPKSLHAELEKQAEAEGLSLNSYLVSSLSLIMARASFGQKVIPQDRLEAIAADEFCEHLECVTLQPEVGVCCACDAIYAAREALKAREEKAELELLRSEAKENARIIGMGGSVEAQLRSELEQAKKDKDAAWRQANVAHQHTRCCVCGIDKHTPVRCDDLGGYICGGCLEKAYFEEKERAEAAEAKQEGTLGKLHSIAGTVNFFASVIKSGEPWTPECQKALEKAKELAFGDGK